jgi:hypothetical protein
MYGETIDPNYFTTKGPQSVLARTFLAEYLLSEGYLVSELDELPPKIARKLIRKAFRITALRLTEIESIDKFPWEIRLIVSLN